MHNILKNILSQKRITKEEALLILKDFPTLEIGQLASIAKKQKGIDKNVGFVIDTNPNYTNICDTECLFCAFWNKCCCMRC